MGHAHSQYCRRNESGPCGRIRLRQCCVPEHHPSAEFEVKQEAVIGAWAEMMRSKSPHNRNHLSNRETERNPGRLHLSRIPYLRFQSYSKLDGKNDCMIYIIKEGISYNYSQWQRLKDFPPSSDINPIALSAEICCGCNLMKSGERNQHATRPCMLFVDKDLGDNQGKQEDTHLWQWPTVWVWSFETRT
jgi:hypothetical protein